MKSKLFLFILIGGLLSLSACEKDAPETRIIGTWYDEYKAGGVVYLEHKLVIDAEGNFHEYEREWFYLDEWFERRDLTYSLDYPNISVFSKDSIPELLNEYEITTLTNKELILENDGIVAHKYHSKSPD